MATNKEKLIDTWSYSLLVDEGERLYLDRVLINDVQQTIHINETVKPGQFMRFNITIEHYMRDV